MTDLSVVLISRNQEWNIARLIQSVLDGTSCVTSREIVLVDSSSTDRTVDIARGYPITVLCLRADQRLSSHAGRYVGYRNTSCEFVLFLDGDMEFCSGWMEKALAVFKSQPEVAVVAGPWTDLPKTTRPDDKIDMNLLRQEYADEEVSLVGGAAMYRRSILEQVGPFNPWLYSDGEPELCVRISHAGYRILRIGHPIAYHYSDPDRVISTAVRRRGRKLYLGNGQAMRYHLGSELFWPYLRERGYGCIPALGLAVGAASFVTSVVTGQWLWFYGWCLLLFLVLLADAIRKRSLYSTLYSLINRLFVIEGTTKGFLLRPLDPETYPARFDVVSRPARANSSRITDHQIIETYSGQPPDRARGIRSGDRSQKETKKQE
jgi:glycosyltransferase involved in cell wall biosynthesis